jgi:hypothetical protein
MSARARGFIADWRPRPATCALLDKVQSILLQYAAQLPLTLRQIFYILVDRHAYDKTEQAYERLGEALGRARRSRLISMSAIRDDGFTELAPTYWDSADDFLRSCLGMSASVRLDRQLGPAPVGAVVRGRRHGAATRAHRRSLWHHGDVVRRFRQSDRQTSGSRLLGRAGDHRPAYRRSRSERGFDADGVVRGHHRFWCRVCGRY